MNPILAAPVECLLTMYPRTRFRAGDAVVEVLGAHAALAGRVEAWVSAHLGSWDASRIRSLHLDVPGLYALLIRTDDELCVATDPYGILKLYWTEQGGRGRLADDAYAFAGESFPLEEETLKCFFAFGYTPARHTFFKGLSKLEPCTFHRFRDGRLAEATLYANLEGDRMGGEDFLARFQSALEGEVDGSFRESDSACLFLTGGLDSSFLYELVRSRGRGERLSLKVGRTLGLQQTRPLDNDFDIEYARRLAAQHGQDVEVVPYDMAGPGVVEDFHWLRRHLFTEYAPAMAYVGLGRSVPADRLILNGQNADSILSFGSMGSPRWSGRSITGLHGFFSRYFQFFGTGFRPTPLHGLSVFLRSLYYRRNYGGPQDYSERSLLLGLGLQPENKFFRASDSAFVPLADPERWAQWFEGAYLDPLARSHGHLDLHARAVLLYNRTYMQGAANRSTVLSALLQGRSIRLPYTALGLLELMANLRPDWHYAFHGKYPNVVVGSRLGLPDFIIERSDPSDCDSTLPIFQCLEGNGLFAEYAQATFRNAVLDRYEGVLAPAFLARLRIQQATGELPNWGLLLKLIWVESTLAAFGNH